MHTPTAHPADAAHDLHQAATHLAQRQTVRAAARLAATARAYTAVALAHGRPIRWGRTVDGSTDGATSHAFNLLCAAAVCFGTSTRHYSKAARALLCDAATRYGAMNTDGPATWATVPAGGVL